MAEARRALDQHSADTDRLRQTLAARAEAANGSGQLVAALREWITRQPASTRYVEFAVAPKLEDGETLPKALGRIRAQLADLDNETVAATGAVPPLKSLREAAVRLVDGLAGEGAPIVRPREDGELDVVWRSPGAFVAGLLPVDAARMLAWLDRDKLLERLNERIDAFDRTAPGLRLTPLERATRLANLSAQMLQLSHQEEAVVRRAEGDGFHVQRRPSADPRAVLGVEEKGMARAVQRAA